MEQPSLDNVPKHAPLDTLPQGKSVTSVIELIKLTESRSVGSGDKSIGAKSQSSAAASGVIFLSDSEKLPP